MAGEIAALNVLISGDAKPLTNALNEAKGSLINFSNLANSLEQLRPFSPFIVQAIESAKSVGQLNDALAQLKIEQAAALDPKELQAYNAVIKSVGIEIKSLSAAGTASGIQSIGKSFTEAFSGLRQIAYILPGIGIAGIFNLAFEAISKAADQMGIFTSQTDEAAKATAEAKKQIDGFEESAAKEVFSLRELTTVAADVNIPYQTRLQAVKNLREEYPTYLSNLTDEQILSGQIGDALDKINAGLRAKIQLQAAQEKLLPLIKDELDTQLKLSAAQKDIATLSTFSDKELLANKELTKLYVDRKNAIKNVVDLSALDVQQQAKINELFQALQGIIEKAAPLEIKVDNTKAKEKIKEVKEAFQGLDLYALKGSGAPLEAPTTANAPDSPLIAIGDAALKQVQNISAKMQAEAARLQKTLQEAFAKVFVNAFKSLGEGLGNVLSGKENPFEAFGRFMADTLKQLGDHLIKLGVQAELIKVALKNPFSGANPVLLIASGIALEALGTAFNNFVTPHAEGGIFDKPTLIGSHLFGEAGPEALLPLNRLPSMLGNLGGNQKIEVTGSIGFGYDKLLIAINRANQFTSRNYGNFSAG